MIYYLLLLIALLPVTVHAQAQEGKLFLYNAGFSGITAGVGAVFNQPKGANWKKTFVRAFWQGAIGGTLHYSAKKTLYLINDQRDIIYGLPAMMLQNAGNSMVENAAYGRPFLSSWHLDYGPVRLDYSHSGRHSFKARLLPACLYGSILGAGRGDLDWKLTLLTGCMSFQADIRSPKAQLFNKAGVKAGGVCFGRAIFYPTSDGKRPFQSIAHELVHYFQFTEFQAFNTWLTPFGKKTQTSLLGKVFDRYVYFDAPYSFPPYIIEGYHSAQHYYKNFFEWEAERFATNRDVLR